MKSTKQRVWFVASSTLLSASLALGCSAGSSGGSGVHGQGASDSGGNGNGGDTAPSGAGFAPVSVGGSTIDVDPGSMGGAQSCASDSQAADTVPLSLYILLDQSGSMTEEGNRWAPVTTALKAFIGGTSLGGVGIGLQYFPLGATVTSDPKICTAMNYATADVPVQDLPANANPLTASIDNHFFTAAMGDDPAHWGTPTYPALQGSYAYLRSYLTANPARRGVLLLATDGQPSKLCDGDTDKEITALIASQAALTPAIQTYVIGIGNVASLNDWATAGGTGHAAFIVDGVGTTTQADLTKALDEIRLLALPCDYAIPAPSSGTIDPTKVNVRFTPDGQAPVDFLNVPAESACAAGTQTWYYDNPTAPTRVIMCPAACDALHQQGAKIDVVFGCTTEVYVPK